MGKLTQLHQGSLNGLRRQTNECIDSAYRKGYEDGKKEPREVTNVEDTNEYQIGYKVGYDKGYYDGYDKCLHSSANDDYEKGKLDGLEEFENLFINEHDYEQFFEDTYGTKDPDYNLYDLVAKYGAKKVLKDFKKWQEEKKKVEEIKVGDEVMYLPNDTKFYVIAVSPERYKGLYYAEYNKYLPITICDFEKDECKKTGRHIDEIEQLLNKLGSDEE